MKMKKYFKKYRRTLTIAGITALSFLPIAAADNYFEISKNMEIYSDIYKNLNMYYVDDIDPNKLMRDGVDAMLQSLDPYTNYISEAEMEGYRLQTTGKYGGIGAAIKKRGDEVIIVDPYENAPAFNAGIHSGDIILKVDGKEISHKTADEISKILKGQPGTEVTLLISRPGMGMEEEFVLTRQDITVENVPYYGMVSGDIGYIRLDQFTQHSGRNVEKALSDLKNNQGAKKVILDLRSNPGGLLPEAVNVSNIFIEKNKLVVSTKGKVADWDRDFKTLNKPLDTEMPVVVLSNKSSASASEIVAGTMQDYDRGIVVGQKSFGKGLVQQTRDVSYNTKLKLTIAKYYTPSGRCIQAIDYSHKDKDGTVGQVPDSLRSAFETPNGRTVYDGAGIEPDIEIDENEYAKITRSLISGDHIFDFATQYYQSHDSIVPAKEFKLSDAEYEDFISFLSGKEYDYKTETEEQLDNLIASTKDELYYDAVSEDLNSLKSQIQHDKDKDLIKFKDEIRELIEAEIASRYYAQKGRIEASFDDDQEIRAAVDLLNDLNKYNQLLQP